MRRLRGSARAPAAWRGVLVSALLVCTGCIGVQSNDARDFARFPPEALAGESMHSMKVEVSAQATGVAADNALRANLMGDVENAYVHWLSRTKRVKGGDAPRYLARLQVTDEGGDRGTVAAAVLSGLTLYVIPSWSTHRYTTTVEIFETGGRKLGSRRFEHRLRLVQQLFLVFGMPFAGLQSAYDRMWNEVTRDAAAWTVEVLDAGAAVGALSGPGD